MLWQCSQALNSEVVRCRGIAENHRMRADTDVQHQASNEHQILLVDFLFAQGTGHGIPAPLQRANATTSSRGALRPTMQVTHLFSVFQIDTSFALLIQCQSRAHFCVFGTIKNP